jgi:hypothetical protein
MTRKITMMVAATKMQTPTSAGVNHETITDIIESFPLVKLGPVLDTSLGSAVAASPSWGYNAVK